VKIIDENGLEKHVRARKGEEGEPLGKTATRLATKVDMRYTKKKKRRV